ncbi:uncharacterized protein LOC143213253 isoform X2 [Lasioglossum baleicum]|uniref:uncharacterized protein LOC143213253 isoform X2 n=1 Tax=Lasioglossum baleicum TaxID=434251 RepID=UPI003FCE05E8
MLRATTLLLFISLHAGLSYGMQCSFNEQNILGKILTSCPGILDPTDKSYCCYNLEGSYTYCCDVYEFTTQASWAGATIIVVSVIVVSVVVFCISCICCICCRRYRRRNQGTVYEHVQVPHVVRVIHTPANVLPQSDYVVNSAMSAPTLVNPHDMYAKPPPYNTSYVDPAASNM